MSFEKGINGRERDPSLTRYINREYILIFKIVHRLWRAVEQDSKAIERGYFCGGFFAYIAAPNRDETLLARGLSVSPLDEREKRRKEREGARRAAGRAICIGMQAPALRVTLASARARAHARRTHARSIRVTRTYAWNSQGRKPRVSSNASSAKAR